MRPKSPCLNCEKRVSKCQDHCYKFLGFKIKNEMYSRKLRESTDLHLSPNTKYYNFAKHKWMERK